MKFIIPKLIIKDPNKDELYELMNSVDLSTYGFGRIKLNETIGLDATESELDPQNPNPHGAHREVLEEELDMIIWSFNER